MLTEALGELLGELEDVARLLAVQLDVEGGHEHPGPDFVEVVGRGEAFDRLVVDEALDVDLREVAVDERRLGVLEVGEALAQLVDLGVDRLVADVGCRDLDLQRVVALDRDLGTDLDDGVELDVAVFLARGDVDLGRRDHVDALGDDGFEVELRQRVVQRLVACDLGAEPGFEDAPRRFTGTEAVDLHLVRELAERRVDRTLEVGGRDRDVQTNLVVVEGFDRGLERHGAMQPTRGPHDVRHQWRHHWRRQSPRRMRRSCGYRFAPVADERVHDEAARYRELVHVLDEGVVFQDRTGTVVAANDAAGRILGVAPDDLIGSTANDPRFSAAYVDGTLLQPDDTRRTSCSSRASRSRT